MTRKDRITATLTKRFAPSQLRVVDESSQHAGHAGAKPEGETHFRVEITAAAFKGLPRVASHRLVYDALKDEFNAGLHALAVEAKAG